MTSTGTLAIGDLDGVGEKSERLFLELGIATARDLLDDFPFRYEDLREPMSAADLREARLDDESAGEVNALGRITAVKERRVRDLEIVEARLQDESGAFVAKWIGRRRYVFGRLHEGMRLFVRGRLERSLVEPAINVTQHRVLGEEEVYRGEMLPVYRASKELPSRKIASVVKKNLARLLSVVGEDVLPPALVRERGFGALRDAYRIVHAPPSPEEAARARERFIFGEFLVLATGTQLRRAQREGEHDAVALQVPKNLLEQFEASLPFALTGAQRRVIDEIWSDLSRDMPMNRLLQGDVGSGKTLVAAAAVLLAARGGFQSALMAPTEILAMQHVQKLTPLLLPFQIAVEPVLGSQGQRSRRAAVDRLASGEAALAIGTHALLTQDVEFARLGLVIIDEQHRFGVEHRARLRAKGGAPHTLHMTATPIPRTLAQSLYADLDESRLDEMPPGRTPIQTFAVRLARLERVYTFVRAVVARGGQAYIVAPAIEEGESGATSVVAEMERLQADVFADLRLGLVHGRLPSREKDDAMQRFARGEIDVLVATTVIEVGVDVANASVMVVLDAQRYGLAQLHQLRGRVGRGAAQSFCIFVYPDDRQETKRLAILTQTTDGFAIAEADLRMRGSGEFAGTAQSGHAELRFGDVARDFEVYRSARRAAEQIVKRDPRLRAPEHAGLRGALDATPSVHALLASS
ncbi:MAG TPA: ATP-dependent DNA helicase RecG [Candidatus Tyrphobacter sp.]